MSVSLWNDEQEKPVQHLRIVDLTIMLPGPLLTRTLVQYGADVVKVEITPDGDPLRKLSDSSLFELLNAGKRSVAVDLKTDEGAELVRQLAGEADVFIENFREGVMDRFGLGYSDISEVNPDLLYCSLRGFAGNNASRAGHDLNFIAHSGCGEWFLETGQPNYSTQFGDMVGGALVPLTKILFHLANPARRGMHLITSMDESFRALFLPRAYEAIHGDKSGKKSVGVQDIFNGKRPHSRYYRCRDQQWVSLNAVQKKHWDGFCEVVDRVQWKNRQEDESLVAEVEKMFQDAPASYWEALCNDRELCLFRVMPWSEHLLLTQAKTLLEHDPLNWAGFPANPNLSPAPILGADSFSVVSSLGLPNKQIAEWMEKKILVQHPSGVEEGPKKEAKVV